MNGTKTETKEDIKNSNGAARKGGKEILDPSRGGASDTKANRWNDEEATAPVEIFKSKGGGRSEK